MPSRNPYNGSVVWIIGASSGIGKGLAIAFAGQGAKLILSARRVDALQEVREACLALTPDVEVLPVDLSEPASHEQAAAEAASFFGPIDMLVHSGGITSRGLAHATRLDVDRRVMEVNFFGVVSLTRAVLPSMMERGSGHIVVISSVVGKVGTQFRSAYAASKHALHGWFDSLRVESDPHGVAVTLVCPGFIATELTMNALTENGTALGKMTDAQLNGMPTAEFSRRLLPKLAARRHEVVIGGVEVLSIWIKRFFPRLLHAILLRTKVT